MARTWVLWTAAAALAATALAQRSRAVGPGESREFYVFFGGEFLGLWGFRV